MFSLTKFFDRVNLHQKLCQRTLMDFDGLEIHPIYLKTLTDFDGNWPIKTSSELCKQKHTSLKNGDQEIQIYVVE
jgi:hypothetical protein